jgi:hypothetical protein
MVDKFEGRYRREDIAHMLHGTTVPKEFANSANRIFAEGHELNS